MLQRIPDTENIKLKPAFVERYQKLLGDRYDSFIEYSFSFLRRAIRVNTLKSNPEEIKKRLSNWTLTPIPWTKNGFWIEGQRRDVGNLIESVLGYFYIQESVSMIPPIVLNPKPGEIVLDMCSAPGSKSTQIASMMENQGLLVCNDVTGARLRPLGINLQKSGIQNAIITLNKGQYFKKAEIQFDKILVDAPCSGTGTIRRSLKTVQVWNPYMIKRLSGIQKSLIITAYDILKPGGTMVYSTCSVEPEENEAVITHLLEERDAKIENIELNIKSTEPYLEFEGSKFNPEVKKCLRIWPMDNDTEGFFVTKIKKSEK